MHILHFTASYHISKFYKDFIDELDKKSIKQTMYVALKDIRDADKNKIKYANNIDFVYAAPFKRLDSYIYYSKINKIFKDVEKKINLKDIDLVHAHFLFSDGGIAYKLKKKYGIDYIVAIRNTDLNFFFKYGYHVRKYGVEILKNAKKIILVSESYRLDRLNQYLPVKHQKEIQSKMITLPNGISDYWLNNRLDGPKDLNYSEKVVNLIFIGDLNENKNILTTLKVVENLQNKNFKVHLKIVGEGPLKEKVESIILENKLNVSLYGYINSQDTLKILYRDSDIFIMPSFRETFGLVYIEAMSQGLPVLYTENEGIYGFFKEGLVGYGSQPNNVEEIEENLIKILKNYNNISNNVLRESIKFSWDKITDEYLVIYNQLIEKD